MNVIGKPLVVELGSDTTLSALLEVLEGEAAKALVLNCGGQEIRAGYHVTEVKAGEFATLDCGGNPDRWRETVLQVEDVPAEEGQTFMRVGKFRAILDTVAKRIALDPQARLTFEVSDAESPMEIFDPIAVTIERERVVVNLAGRPAICKPRHRAKPVPRNAGCCAGSETTCCV
jgi:Family of unknown function (DUF6428)